MKGWQGEGIKLMKKSGGGDVTIREIPYYKGEEVKFKRIIVWQKERR